jgi:hypothetical protein
MTLAFAILHKEFLACHPAIKWYQNVRPLLRAMKIISSHCPTPAQVANVTKIHCTIGKYRCFGGGLCRIRPEVAIRSNFEF